MSRLLAIETATSVTAVALCGEGIEREVVVDDARRHTEALAPAVADLLDEAGWSLAGLDAVVVDVGPGLFTGLRVGVAFAKGVSVASGVGIYGVASSDALCEAARAAGVRGRVACVVDARRKEVFAAVHDIDEGSSRTLEPVALWSPASLGEHLAEVHPGCALVGDGAVRHAGVLPGEPRGDLVVPSPLGAARLCAARLARGEAPRGHAGVHVWYLRDADAVANYAVRGAPR